MSGLRHWTGLANTAASTGLLCVTFVRTAVKFWTLDAPLMWNGTLIPFYRRTGLRSQDEEERLPVADLVIDHLPCAEGLRSKLTSARALFGRALVTSS